MMHTVDTTSATSTILSNLQCNTQYNISVYAGGRRTSNWSVPRVVSLAARGIVIVDKVLLHFHEY